MQKDCTKCEQSKNLDNFYKHAKMKDGHLNKCKECCKKDSVENRSKNTEYYREYDKVRYVLDPKVRERNERYAKTKNGKEKLKKLKQEWKERNPDKVKAYSVVSNSIRDEKLIKPEHCSCCGNKTASINLHAHHHDYSKPLDITWLCITCHAFLHYPD